jgi:hypothetical protein
LLTICFAPSLSDSLIFVTLTRLVVVLKFINFRFTLFSPPLGDFYSPSAAEGASGWAEASSGWAEASPGSGVSSVLTEG